jgi:hypothetical protein
LLIDSTDRNIGGREDEIVFDVLLYVEIFFTRQNTAKRHSKAMHA